MTEKSQRWKRMNLILATSSVNLTDCTLRSPKTVTLSSQTLRPPRLLRRVPRKACHVPAKVPTRPDRPRRKQSSCGWRGEPPRKRPAVTIFSPANRLASHRRLAQQVTARRNWRTWSSRTTPSVAIGWNCASCGHTRRAKNSRRLCRKVSKFTRSIRWLCTVMRKRRSPWSVTNDF